MVYAIAGLSIFAVLYVTADYLCIRQQREIFEEQETKIDSCLPSDPEYWNRLEKETAEYRENFRKLRRQEREKYHKPQTLLVHLDDMALKYGFDGYEDMRSHGYYFCGYKTVTPKMAHAIFYDHQTGNTKLKMSDIHIQKGRKIYAVHG